MRADDLHRISPRYLRAAEDGVRLHDLQNDLLHVSRLSAMSELASALAHELNQPLAAIKNHGLAGRHLLRASPDSREKVVEILDRTVEQATRAGEVIRRLRSFLQKRDVETALEDLDKVIEEASALAFIGINEKGIRVAMLCRPFGQQRTAYSRPLRRD